MHDERHQALIDADRRHLVRAATRLLGPLEAEDAVQDAYVRALETRADALDVAQAWLLTVVKHVSIDRLRRRDWLQRWLVAAETGDAACASPSAELEAALREDVARALSVLAATLPPADGAAVLLHEVFDASHLEIALASGRTEAGSRQLLRRALLKLRQSGGASGDRRRADRDPSEDHVFRQFLQSLQLRDPQALWAMLRQPTISASAQRSALAPQAHASPTATCGVLQAGGQLGLVLTLDGVTLCVLPLGVRSEQDVAPMVSA